ncbi:MAG: hypothetical protein MK207_06480 [Saprospiraceae bacterium]|nr:hypothetical protein [Saprospiraceae bacterium]
MSFEVLDSSEEQKIERPLFLTVICLFSFVGSGSSILFYGLIIMGVGIVSDIFPGITGLSNSGVKIYLLIAIFISLLSLFGSIKMWQLRKLGFYFYLLSCFASVFFPFLFGYGMPRFDVMVFVFLFVLLYGMNLKYMI